jgi:hypothetical protein
VLLERGSSYKHKGIKYNQVQGFMAVLPALTRLKQNCKFEASLNYIVRPCLKKKKLKYIAYMKIS